MINLAISSLWIGDSILQSNLNIATDSQRLFLYGACGCGKSVLARALCGGAGRNEPIRMTGQAQLGPHRLSYNEDGLIRTPECRIGYLPQTPSNFFITKSVQAEVFLSLACSSPDVESMKCGWNRWLEGSALKSRASVPPLSLSGGQQRMLMFEALLATEPSHMVIDGGLGVLDDDARSIVRRMINQWLAEDRNRTCIYFDEEPSNNILDINASFRLGPASAEGEINTDHLRIAGRAQGEELLRYADVVGGPIMHSGQHLIDHVSFRISSGEVVGLTGNNGIGKSTLLRLCAGVQPLHAGEIFFRGRPLTTGSWSGLAGGIAFLPQEPELAGPMFFSDDTNATLSRNVKEWAHEYGIPFGEIGDYWCMSAGERVRLSLILQATNLPALWMLDEPGMRIENIALRMFLRKIVEKQPDTAVIIVSHDRPFLTKTVDRLLELRETGIVES